nr:M15 family metallopeptidase [Pedobacter sp. ASV19]
MALKLIQRGSRGAAVKDWQFFLSGQNLYSDLADGIFGQHTYDGTVAFQKLSGIKADGIVGNQTYGAAMLKGFNKVQDDRDIKESANWPPKPNFTSINSNAIRQQMFGKMEYISQPQPGNPEHIKIINNWAQNIVTVNIPQLKGILKRPEVQFHKAAKDQLIALWARWERDGMLDLVKSWEGSYEPRFERNSRTVLSNHAFGTAFDINEKWNKFHTLPALVGNTGSVRELVPAANELGFYWGGHFSRPDGMHFEIAKLL